MSAIKLVLPILLSVIIMSPIVPLSILSIALYDLSSGGCSAACATGRIRGSLSP